MKRSIGTDTWWSIRSISTSALNDDGTVNVSACSPVPQLCIHRWCWWRKNNSMWWFLHWKGSMALEWVTQGPVVFAFGFLRPGKTWPSLDGSSNWGRRLYQNNSRGLIKKNIVVMICCAGFFVCFPASGSFGIVLAYEVCVRDHFLHNALHKY